MRSDKWRKWGENWNDGVRTGSGAVTHTRRMRYGVRHGVRHGVRYGMRWENAAVTSAPRGEAPHGSLTPPSPPPCLAPHPSLSRVPRGESPHGLCNLVSRGIREAHSEDGSGVVCGGRLDAKDILL